MRQQSATYNPFTDTRTVDFEVSFGLINEEAKNKAIANSNGTSARTSVDQTLDRKYKGIQNWATFETRGWILGEGNKILPSDSSAEQLGWWSSAETNDSGDFEETIPYIEFDFGEAITTYGWSLYFDEKNGIFPTVFNIIAYATDGSTVLFQKRYENYSAKSFISAIVEDYGVLKIEFLRMNQPYRKVRLLEVDFGMTQRFDKDTLVKATVVEDVDIAAQALPSRQLTFVFDNSMKIYNMLKPDLLYDYFSSGSEIFAKIIINGEEVSLGQFFFTNATTKSNSLTAEITANDIIMRLNDIMYSRTEGAEMTLEEAVDIILEGINVEREYEGNVRETKVYLSPVSSFSKREMIRLLAQASMCTCYVNRDGVMVFKRIETAEDSVGAIDKDALYNYNGISVSDPVSKVILSANDPTVYGGIRLFEAGEGANVVEITNACVHDDNGTAVAEWLLSCLKRRVHYKVKNRCDPAVEIGDTVRLDDSYGENLNASVTGIDLRYTGGVYATTEAVI